MYGGEKGKKECTQDEDIHISTFLHASISYWHECKSQMDGENSETDKEIGLFVDQLIINVLRISPPLCFSSH